MLEKILKLNQDELLDFTYESLLRRGYKNKNILYTDDYVYAKGNIPILLVAHCDIVHKDVPEIIVNDRKQRILWSPTGIGGDDRCGVYGVLKICEKLKPYVLFTTEEEKGGIGVKQFTKDVKELPVDFIIEIDRKGNEEVVFYQCANKDFQNYIISFGFTKNFGSYSDVSTLSTHYDIAGCNVSAGYYNQHTSLEYIVMEHLENSLEKVIAILKDTTNHKHYDCQEIKYEYKTNYKKWDYYEDDYYDDDDCYWDYKEKVWKKRKKLKKPKENQVIEEEEKTDGKQIEIDWDKVTEKEDDWYDLTPAEWKDKYGTDKPLSVLDVYDI